MKNPSIYIIFLLFTVLLNSCVSTQSDKVIITGEYTWNQWQKSAEWGRYDAEEYEPGTFLTEQISEISRSRDIDFILFSGSWCHDSELEVPKIYKLFDAANIAFSKIKLYGVDRDKRESQGIAEKYEIEKVPTLIVLNAGNELGRVVEFPETSWEEDIFKILVK